MNDLRPLINQSPPVDVSRPCDPTTLHDKFVLITGASNGLGAMMARFWASHGAHIAIGDIDDSAGEALVSTLRTTYPKQTFVYQHCDVLDWDSQCGLFEAARRVSPHGGIDIVVPNAGVHIGADALQFEAPAPKPDGSLRKPRTTTLDINITGVYFTTHLALHYLAINPSSSSDRAILLLGSIAGLMPLPGQAPYSMSKHAMTGLFRCLRCSIPAQSIRVNMICPYFVSGSRMVKPAVEAVLLAGAAGSAGIPDVLDAATRLIADNSIRGRALVVGPKMKDLDGLAEGKDTPLTEDELRDGGRAIWECFAHDYDEVEAFRWRYMKLMNAIAQTRSWVGWVKDILTIFWRK